jgi:hypothetical protein
MPLLPRLRPRASSAKACGRKSLLADLRIGLTAFGPSIKLRRQRLRRLSAR